jgi:nucleoside-diphosphate-sugar epimerase
VSGTSSAGSHAASTASRFRTAAPRSSTESPPNGSGGPSRRHSSARPGVVGRNVGDPRDFTFGALAALVAARLDWAWEPVVVRWEEGDHPWNVRHPVIADTSRLRQVLGVTEPDPVAETIAQIEWLWEHRAAASTVPG